jgi:hypothetical protein
MSEHDRNLAEMDDEDLDRHKAVQSVIQEVIDGLGRDAEGRDPADIQVDLTAALAERGIGEQPPRWLDAVATALSNGHRYVEDARAAEPPAQSAARAAEPPVQSAARAADPPA